MVPRLFIRPISDDIRDGELGRTAGAGDNCPGEHVDGGGGVVGAVSGGDGADEVPSWCSPPGCHYICYHFRLKCYQNIPFVIKWVYYGYI